MRPYRSRINPVGDRPRKEENAEGRLLVAKPIPKPPKQTKRGDANLSTEIFNSQPRCPETMNAARSESGLVGRDLFLGRSELNAPMAGRFCGDKLGRPRSYAQKEVERSYYLAFLPLGRWPSFALRRNGVNEKNANQLQREPIRDGSVAGPAPAADLPGSHFFRMLGRPGAPLTRIGLSLCELWVSLCDLPSKVATNFRTWRCADGLARKKGRLRAFAFRTTTHQPCAAARTTPGAKGSSLSSGGTLP
jgi:hypothetical protein